MTDPATTSGTKPAPLKPAAFGITDRGMQREHNEDSFVVLSEFNLFVVADGMGGHRAGDVASRIATETIADFFRSTANDDVTWPFHFDTNLTEEENRLMTGIRVANRQILDRSERSRECHGMGTTVVGIMYSPARNRLFIGHVGDSRCYRVRSGSIALLTKDHSLVNEYRTAMPGLTKAQEEDLPKNVITRALGMHKDVMPELQSDVPQAEDVYVLCSDGLNGMLHDEEILALVDQHRADLTVGARKLIDQANACGGEDNITVVLVRMDTDGAAISILPPGTSGNVIADCDTASGERAPGAEASATAGEGTAGAAGQQGASSGAAPAADGAFSIADDETVAAPATTPSGGS